MSSIRFLSSIKINFELKLPLKIVTNCSAIEAETYISNNPIKEKATWLVESKMSSSLYKILMFK
jgi:hypothetical protein